MSRCYIRGKALSNRTARLRAWRTGATQLGMRARGREAIDLTGNWIPPRVTVYLTGC